jgi:hypothetical protein
MKETKTSVFTNYPSYFKSTLPLWNFLPRSRISRKLREHARCSTRQTPTGLEADTALDFPRPSREGSQNFCIQDLSVLSSPDQVRQAKVSPKVPSARGKVSKLVAGRGWPHICSTEHPRSRSPGRAGLRVERYSCTLVQRIARDQFLRPLPLARFGIHEGSA